MQLVVLTQQIVQVQVFLGETDQVQSGNDSERLAQHGLLTVGQRGIALHLAPGIPEAFR
ncbi:hypothetical protein D3C72_2314690 [compost metagenome]